MRWFRLSTVAVTLLGCTTVVLPPPARPARSLPPEAAQVEGKRLAAPAAAEAAAPPPLIHAVNRLRAHRGLPPLRYLPTLSRIVAGELSSAPQGAAETAQWTQLKQRLELNVNGAPPHAFVAAHRTVVDSSLGPEAQVKAIADGLDPTGWPALAAQMTHVAVGTRRVERQRVAVWVLYGPLAPDQVAHESRQATRRMLAAFEAHRREANQPPLPVDAALQQSLVTPTTVHLGVEPDEVARALERQLRSLKPSVGAQAVCRTTAFGHTMLFRMEDVLVGQRVVGHTTFTRRPMRPRLGQISCIALINPAGVRPDLEPRR